MAIVSSKITDGQTASASAVNNLREDLLTNHDHDGTKGAQIDHGNLANDGTITHAQVDTHVVGSGSFDDDPGGDLGVHGLNEAIYVMGAGGSQLVMQCGVCKLDTLIDTLDAGAKTLYGHEVTFAPTFSTVIAAVATYKDKPFVGEGGSTEALYITDLTTSGMSVVSANFAEATYNSWYDPGEGDRYAYWIAIGTIAK